MDHSIPQQQHRAQGGPQSGPEGGRQASPGTARRADGATPPRALKRKAGAGSAAVARTPVTEDLEAEIAELRWQLDMYQGLLVGSVLDGDG